jgi:hypothetical protein
VIPELNQKKDFFVQYRNHGFKIGYSQKPFFNQELQTEAVSILPQDGPTEVYAYDDTTHQWKIELLHETCQAPNPYPCSSPAQGVSSAAS